MIQYMLYMVKKSTKHDSDSDLNDDTSSQDSALAEKYKQKDLRQHILDLPDTYIGSIEEEESEMWIYDDDENLIVKKQIKYVPGFYKTCDELIVNARDHEVNNEKHKVKCNTIKLNIDQETGEIVVWNNGDGIEVVKHPKYKVYIPEFIFGNLMTSSNYETKKKIVGGKNGFGAKLANIWSKKFIVETVDAIYNKKYVQEFKNNMTEKSEPIITTTKKTEQPYTKITYFPDYERFRMDGLSDDVFALLKKRAYDLAACTDKNTKIYLNDELLNVKTFKDFIKMHYSEDIDIIYEEEDNGRWKVGLVYEPDDGNKQISFVNGIWTYQGGEHVNYILNQISKHVIEFIKEKHKKYITKSQIIPHLTLFLDAVIEDPAFTSQTKGELKTKISNFGSTCKLSSIFLNKLNKSKLIDTILKYAEVKELNSLSKTDGKRVARLNIPDLIDAEYAGTNRSKDTRLILIEGKSAKTCAVSGIGVIGKEYYGVFPLRGKMLNVRNATIEKIKNNKEVENLKKIMGLKQNEIYNDTSKLRYGGIVILTDQDPDGSHIKGLIINIIQCFWPELLKIKGFIQTLSTPLLKAFPSNKQSDIQVFYAVSEYENWAKNINKKQWTIKYYKGLGTHSKKESEEIFKDYNSKIVSFEWEDMNESDDELSEQSNQNSISGKKTRKPKKQMLKTTRVLQDDILKSESYNAITLAYEKNRADDRKLWLKKYDRNNTLDYNCTDIKYSEFINKDLIHFSMEDNIRSIPSIVDGLKPSQRKILYGCFKKNVRKDLKVAQLGAYVSEHTQYKHGEQSLYETIIGMAQRFPTSNNISLLYPCSSFGTRSDPNSASQPRYIYTYIDPITFKIFRSEDQCILDYILDDGTYVEPEYYFPIIPTILINGTIGIGTGYSTEVPMFNILDICNNLKRKLNGKEFKEMMPWINGFTGKIEKIEENKYESHGKFTVLSDSSIQITEIPINISIDDYENFLRDFESKDDSIIKSFTRNTKNNIPDFKISFKSDNLQKLLKNGDECVLKELKLISKISTTNMHLYNEKNEITKYNSCLDIFENYYQFRLKMYAKRKQLQLKIIENDINILKYKIQFINDIINEKIIINKQSKDKIIKNLESKKYPKLSRSIFDDEDDKSYDYLTSMYLFSLTKEKIEDLNNEHKQCQMKYDDYNSITVEKLWEREIDEVIEYYPTWLEEWEREEMTDNKENKQNKKKSRKSKK